MQVWDRLPIHGHFLSNAFWTGRPNRHVIDVARREQIAQNGELAFVPDFFEVATRADLVDVLLFGHGRTSSDAPITNSKSRVRFLVATRFRGAVPNGTARASSPNRCA